MTEKKDLDPVIEAALIQAAADLTRGYINAREANARREIAELNEVEPHEVKLEDSNHLLDQKWWANTFSEMLQKVRQTYRYPVHIPEKRTNFLYEE